MAKSQKFEHVFGTTFLQTMMSSLCPENRNALHESK